MRRACSDLPAPDARAVLYDDNVRLGRDSRVVLVEPFLSLSRERCEVVLRYMDEVLPPSDVDEDLIDYLQSGEPHERYLRAGTCGLGAGFLWDSLVRAKCMHVCMHTNIHASIHLCMHPSVHEHTHTHTHTHTHRCLQLDAEGRPSWWASRFRPGM